MLAVIENWYQLVIEDSLDKKSKLNTITEHVSAEHNLAFLLIF